MKRGKVTFYVDVSCLVTFDDTCVLPSSTSLPGKPEQYSVIVDAVSHVATTYPAAGVLLQTLRATGNNVVLFSRWSVKSSKQIIEGASWAAYAQSVVPLRRVPGHEHRHTLLSLGCAADLYASVFVLSSPKTRWHDSMRGQVYVVDHSREFECAHHMKETNPLPSATHSMELLYALAACLTVAESRLRFPSTSVSACYALAVAQLFAGCTFYLPPDRIEGAVVACLCQHGAHFVDSISSATHVLWADGATSNEPRPVVQAFPPGDLTSAAIPRLPVSSSSSAAASTSSSSSTASASFSWTSSSSAGSEDDENDETDDGAVRHGSAASTSQLKSTMPQLQPPDAVPLDKRVSATWISRCCRALRLLPITNLDAISLTSSESLRTTGALLCALLPPVDAKSMLSFSSFVQMCQRWGFPVEFLTPHQTATEVQTRLRFWFGSLVACRRQSPAKDSDDVYNVSSNENAGDSASSDTLLLSRAERRVEKEAVSAHLSALARRYLETINQEWTHEKRQRHRDAGTQICAPTFVSVGVGSEGSVNFSTATVGTQTILAAPEVETVRTDTAGQRAEPMTAPALSAAKTESLHVPPSAPSPAPPTAVTAPEEDRAVQEWVAHLRNAEGKVLRSTSPKPSGTAGTSTLAGPAARADAPQHGTPPPAVAPARPALAPQGTRECFIDASSLTQAERQEALQHIAAFPLFSSGPENTIQMQEHGFLCVFGEPRKAVAFRALQYVDFNGHQLPIATLSKPQEMVSAPIAKATVVAETVANPREGPAHTHSPVLPPPAPPSKAAHKVPSATLRRHDHFFRGRNDHPRGEPPRSESARSRRRAARKRPRPGGDSSDNPNADPRRRQSK